MKFSKKLILSMGIMLLIFVAVCFVFIAKDKIIPDSLIYSFFGLFTGELGVLGWIKKKEDK